MLLFFNNFDIHEISYPGKKTVILTNFNVSRQGIEIFMFIFNTEKITVSTFISLLFLYGSGKT